MIAGGNKPYLPADVAGGASVKGKHSRQKFPWSLAGKGT